MWKVWIAAAALALPSAVLAQAPVGGLGQCLADNTSGRDRKDLARWVFLAMAAHPEIKDLSKATPADADGASKTTGALITRLLTQSCAKEARMTMAAGGANALQFAFQMLGQLAMQELMSDGSVGQSMGAIERHVDQKKINEALGTR
jgi:hypothetical protein